MAPVAAAGATAATGVCALASVFPVDAVGLRADLD